MDDEERLVICQQEIRRLRGVVRWMEEYEERYVESLRQEIEKEDDGCEGLIRALQLWMEI